MPGTTTLSDPRDNTGATGSQSTGLPIRHSLTPAYALSLAIALLMAVAAVAGLLFPATIYPTEEVLLSFAPVDLFHLVVGLPILLGSMWLVRRGQLAGLLCWPGALLYVLYSYVTNLIGVPFGVLFLPYLLLVTLSVYATIVLVASIDSEAVRQRLAGVVPARAAGAVLVVFTSLFILMAVVDIVTALASQRPVGALDLMLWVADLAALSPACLAGGILLLRRRALGYTGGAGLLLVYSMLFIGIIPVMGYRALYSGSAIDLVGVVMMLVLGLICLTLLALFLRGAVPEAERLS